MTYIFKFYLMDDNPQEFAKTIIQLIQKWEDYHYCVVYHHILDKTILYIHLNWKRTAQQFKKFLEDLDAHAVKPYCVDFQVFKELNINL